MLTPSGFIRTKNILFIFCLLYNFLPNINLLIASTTITDRTGNVSIYTAYRLSKERIRHMRLETNQKFTLNLGEKSKVIADARLRLDAVFLPKPFGAYDQASSEVKKDEFIELGFQNLYFDYFGDTWGLKLGLQQFDWTNSIAPNTVDILTPVDLRHGGWGAASDVIIPVWALALNHNAYSLFDAEVMIIPFPKNNRLPKDSNDYGYYEYLSKTTATQVAHINKSENNFEKNSDIEYGIRLTKQLDRIDLNGLYFKAHRRSPSVEYAYDENAVITITQKNPRNDVFGLGLNIGLDEAVIRLYSYYEPKRTPSIIQKNQLSLTMVPMSSTPIFTRTENQPIYEQRQTFGFGLDYTPNQDLKIYSEHLFFHSVLYTLTSEESPNYTKTQFPAFEDNGQSTFILQNESFDDWILKLQTSILYPEIAYILTPEVILSESSFKSSIGGHFFIVKSNKSKIEAYKENNQVYAKLQYYF